MKIRFNLKLLGMVAFLLLITAGLAFFAYFLVNEHKRVSNADTGMALFREGKYAEAKPILLGVVQDDPNNEQAFVALAEISAQAGNWGLETEYWIKAVRLNKLKQEYFENQKRAMAKMRNFRGLASIYAPDVARGQMLDVENTFYCLLSLVNSDKTKDAAKYFKTLEEKKSSFLETPEGAFVKLMLGSEEGEAITEEQLTPFINSSNDIMKFEALYRLGMIYSRDLTKSEQILLQMRKINEYCILPLLEAFYLNTARLDEAAELLIEDYEKFKRPISMIMLAEVYLMNGQKEELAELKKSYNQGGKAGILTGHYLEFLNAYANEDKDGILSAWNMVDQKVNTSLSYFCGLYVAVLKNDFELFARNWDLVHKHVLLNLPQRAELILISQVQNCIVQKNLDEAARYLSLPDAPKYHDEVFARCYLIDAFHKGTLSEKDLDEALAIYPNDLGILQCAVEYYYHQGKYEKSLDYVDQSLKQNPASDSGIHLFRIYDLISLGRMDEGLSLYFEAVKAHPQDTSLMITFTEYCLNKTRISWLRKLLTSLEKGEVKDFPDWFATYVKAEILYFDENKDEALKLFKMVKTDVPKILFRQGYIFGVHDQYDDAMACYKLILDSDKFKEYHTIVLANMAELKFAQGNIPESVEYARKAYDGTKNDMMYLQCYVEKLVAAGDFRTVVALVPLTVLDKAKGTGLIDFWQKAAEAEVKTLFEENRKWDADKLCRSIKSYCKESTVADEYLLKINPPKKEAAAE